MSKEDFFEDNRSIRLQGSVFSVLTLMLAAFPVIGGRFYHSVEGVEQNVAVLALQVLVMLLLCLSAVIMRRGIINEHLRSVYSEVSIILLLTSSLLVISQFFIFFFGVKELAFIPNYSATFLHAITAIVTLKKVISVTK